MRENPKAFEVYKHFKGNMYQILAIAKSSEDETRVVVYQAMYGDFQIYYRPLEMFLSEVDKQKYPNAGQKYRFEKVELGKEAPATEVPDKEFPDKEVPDKEVRPANEKVACDYVAVESDEEPDLDPAILAFFDAKSNEEKLNILVSVKHRVTDEMLATMAIATDVELNPGSVEEKYESLKNCILMKDKFEKVRPW